MDDELKQLWKDSTPEDAERLEQTLAALRAVPDEEIPRRIAFVSDKVFEPKWWQRFPAWGFASAMVLAGSVLAHGYVTRPVTTVINTQPAPVATIDTAALEAQFQKRLDAALKKASAEQERKFDFERRALRLAVEEDLNLMRKRMSRMYMASAEIGSGQ